MTNLSVVPLSRHSSGAVKAAVMPLRTNFTESLKQVIVNSILLTSTHGIVPTVQFSQFMSVINKNVTSASHWLTRCELIAITARSSLQF